MDTCIKEGKIFKLNFLLKDFYNEIVNKMLFILVFIA